MVLVACGWRHTISISDSGSLYTYGWSKYGQLGHGDFEDHLIPHKLEALGGTRISQVILIFESHVPLVKKTMIEVLMLVSSQISGGWRHTMAVTSEGQLYGWGWNKVHYIIAAFITLLCFSSIELIYKFKI